MNTSLTRFTLALTTFFFGGASAAFAQSPTNSGCLTTSSGTISELPYINGSTADDPGKYLSLPSVTDIAPADLYPGVIATPVGSKKNPFPAWNAGQGAFWAVRGGRVYFASVPSSGILRKPIQISFPLAPLNVLKKDSIVPTTTLVTFESGARTLSTVYGSSTPTRFDSVSFTSPISGSSTFGFAQLLNNEGVTPVNIWQRWMVRFSYFSFPALSHTLFRTATYPIESHPGPVIPCATITTYAPRSNDTEIRVLKISAPPVDTSLPAQVSLRLSDGAPSEITGSRLIEPPSYLVIRRM